MGYEHTRRQGDTAVLCQQQQRRCRHDNHHSDRQRPDVRSVTLNLANFSEVAKYVTLKEAK